MRPYDPGAPLASLHVPKCGGNSIMLLLRELFGERFALHYPDPGTGRAPPRLPVGPGWCVHGHFDNTRGQGVADTYPEIEQLVTFLRDPFDMQVSCYFYMRGLSRRGEPSLDERAPEPESTLVTYLERRIEEPGCEPNPLDFLPPGLASDDWQREVDRSFVYLGVTEELRTSAVVLAHRLGGTPMWLGHVNASPRDEEVPEHLRQPFRRSHARQYALYEYARRCHADEGAFRQPIRKSRLEEQELEYRCQLCADYVACTGTGRPRACDGGSAFRPLSRPASGALPAWLDAVGHTNPSSAAQRTVLALRGRDDLWVGPSVAWHPKPALVRMAFGWRDRSVDADLLSKILGTAAQSLLDPLQQCVELGLGPVKCEVSAAGTGLECRLLVPLEPGAVADLISAIGLGRPALPERVYLAEIDAKDGVRLHARADRPAAPLLEALGVTEGSSVVHAVVGATCQPVAIEASLVRSRVDWNDLAGALAGAGLDIGPYNLLKAEFHLVEGAISVALDDPAPIVLHYRVLRSL